MIRLPIIASQSASAMAVQLCPAFYIDCPHALLLCDIFKHHPSWLTTMNNMITSLSHDNAIQQSLPQKKYSNK
jgi:hypothetical protein